MNAGDRARRPVIGAPSGDRAGSRGAERAEQPDGRFTSAAPPSISLPKGGGAIRGIGEKLSANPVTGTGSLAVPIATSPGRSGFGPQLALSYDSGAGNGPFGFGWGLASPSITRKTEKGLPRYCDVEESDTYILSGAEDLVPALIERDGVWQRERDERTLADGAAYSVQRYRPRVEGLFARIERWTNAATAETHWRSISIDNVTTLYGITPESRIADPDDPTRVFSWLICASYDDKGNAIRYDYKPEDGDEIDRALPHEAHRLADGRFANRHLKRIFYGNTTPHQSGEDLAARIDWLFVVVFDYGEHDPVTPTPAEDGAWPPRSDPFSTYRAGFEVRTYRLCRRVLMFHRFAELGETPCLVRSTDFVYEAGPIASFLTTVTQRGYRREGGGYVSRSLPPLELAYTRTELDETVRAVEADSLEGLPSGLDGERYRWVDLDAEGLSGTLTEQADGWFFKRNLSPITARREEGAERIVAGLGPTELVGRKPSLADLKGGRQQLLDLAGNGRLDLVQFADPLPGFFKRDDAGGWETFRPFGARANVDWDDPNLRLVDLTGDGRADLLVADSDGLVWYPSLGEQGFGPPERTHQGYEERRGLALVFTNRTESVYLADMSGDGLSDVVRIRNGEVCYWPNLGYGRFGPRVTMADAPTFDAPDLFDQARIRLADLDGSGLTDIVYLGRGGVDLYFNEAGNGWSAPRRLDHLPRIDNVAAVSVVDLLGNGTACLVWSSPLPGDADRPMRYVDLMSGRKPHLLELVRNNLGAERRVHYAPSTKFYLQDRTDGRPWITRLRFPVHVVERIETFDWISRNRFVTRYAYHHGHYDGVEREFRGFGMVEQWDTEEIGTIAPDAETSTTTNLDAASFVPPVLTRTWFHTGAYLEGRRIEEHFREREYYRGDPSAVFLADTVLPAGLSADEQREACRALNGALLRQEVYAQDGTERTEHPYAVSERNYTIAPLQPSGANRHAAFFAHAREVLDYQYERDPFDPRISHQVTLAVDAFGNVLQSVGIGYGRRRDDPDPLLTDEDRARQRRLTLTLAEHRFTPPIVDAVTYRGPLLYELRTFELIRRPSDSPARVTDPFSFGEVEGLVGAAAGRELPYEDVDAIGATLPDPWYRRPIEHSRQLYYSEDLAGPLPLGQSAPLGLPYETYRLAFTPGLLARAYRRDDENLLPDPVAVLRDEGGYVAGDDGRAHGWFPASDPSGLWWVPSGQQLYSPVPRSPHPPRPPALLPQDSALARANFFLPLAGRDPFGALTRLQYDHPRLLLVQTEDELGNTVRAEHDYRVLQPRLVVDPNGNRSEVRFDALGMVVGTAVQGRAGHAVGDALDDFQTELSDEEIGEFLVAPGARAAALLGTATTRDVYVRGRFERSGQPVFAASLERETHVSDVPNGGPGRVRVSISYSDGFGREIQTKVQAEPGDAPRREAHPTDPTLPGALVRDPATGAPALEWADRRWLGTGRTVFNNKGDPVKQYEPFFSSTHLYEVEPELASTGVTPIVFYDPLGRVVATLHPNHTFEKVVVEPWRRVVWDANDTIRRDDPSTDPDVGAFFRRQSEVTYLPTWHARRRDDQDRPAERDAARKAAAHADTPVAAWFDALGRDFLAVPHNGRDENGAEARYASRSKLDIEGNRRAVTDAKGRLVARYDYDMMGARIVSQSMDAGPRWTLANASGAPMYVWDGRGHTIRFTYDTLRRPTGRFVRVGDVERQDGRTEYGEPPPGDAAAAASARERNLRGQVWRTFDGAGVVTHHDYDFKGNLLRSSRQLRRAYRTEADWSPGRGDELEDEVFTNDVAYDALNRPIQVVPPHAGPTLSVLRPTYGDGNLLERLDVWLERPAVPGPREPLPAPDLQPVSAIDYDARGQRTRVAYGNGAETTFEYDPLTSRLVHLTTRHGGTRLQDLTYRHDPVGNVLEIQDAAQQTVYFDNAVVEPRTSYTYDALYRLVAAEGREHIGQAEHPWTSWSDEPRINLPHPGDPGAMRRYAERYTYDEVGNILEIVHAWAGNGWRRKYTYAEPSAIPTRPGQPAQLSNRLSGTTVGTTADGQPLAEAYAHDRQHGLMTAMPHLSEMAWDADNRLRRVDLLGGGAAYYVYAAGGERIRKVWEKAPGLVEERLYLGGFEVFRRRNGSGAVTLERETLHLMDDARRVGLVETRTLGDDDSPARLTRYQFGSHLGSALLELDDAARIISYEEYSPYGSTTYQAVDRAIKAAAKRYRYTGKERDEETGFSYHDARYYAPWLGRWTSPDPAGLADGPNLYCYVGDNPIVAIDVTGLFSDHQIEGTGAVQWKMANGGKVQFPSMVDQPLTIVNGPDAPTEATPKEPPKPKPQPKKEVKPPPKSAEPPPKAEEPKAEEPKHDDAKDESGLPDIDKSWRVKGSSHASDAVGFAWKALGDPDTPVEAQVALTALLPAALAGAAMEKLVLNPLLDAPAQAYESGQLAARSVHHAMRGEYRAAIKDAQKSESEFKDAVLAAISIVPVGKLGAASKAGGAMKGIGALTTAEKTVLRWEARVKWMEATGKEIPKGWEVHHAIPLEYSHLFAAEEGQAAFRGMLDPNRLENLRLMKNYNHWMIHTWWTMFRLANAGGEGPTAGQVEQAAELIRQEAWRLMRKPPGG